MGIYTATHPTLSALSKIRFISLLLRVMLGRQRFSMHIMFAVAAYFSASAMCLFPLMAG